LFMWIIGVPAGVLAASLAYTIYDIWYSTVHC